MNRRRIPISAAATAGALVVLGGCWSTPSGPDSADGTRMIGDELEVWLGAECDHVASIDVDLRDEERSTLDHWTVQASGATTVETFTAGVAPDGFTETDPLEVDIPTADIAVVTITRSGGDSVEFVAQVTDLLEDPAPDDHSWQIAYRGWTDAEEVQKLIDDGELAPVCA